MSGRRPTKRLTAKNKSTDQYTEIGVFWPPYKEGYETQQFTFNRELTEAQLIEFFRESKRGKESNYYLDLRDNAPRAERQDF